MKEIFGFKQTMLIDHKLEVFHALILRWIVDHKKKFNIHNLFDDLPIIRKDIRMVGEILCDLQEKDILTFEFDNEYNFTIEMKDSDLVKSKKEDYSLFDEFWALYNFKVGTAMCKKKWAKLPMEDRKAIIEALPAYLSSSLGKGEKEDKANFKPRRKNPLTYLNGRYWEDSVEKVESEYDKLRKTAK